MSMTFAFAAKPFSPYNLKPIFSFSSFCNIVRAIPCKHERSLNCTLHYLSSPVRHCQLLDLPVVYNLQPSTVCPLANSGCSGCYSITQTPLIHTTLLPTLAVWCAACRAAVPAAWCVGAWGAAAQCVPLSAAGSGGQGGHDDGGWSSWLVRCSGGNFLADMSGVQEGAS